MSEAGVWRVRDLAVPGGLVGGPFGSSLGTKDYVPSGVPVIRGQNLASDKLFDSTEFVYVSEGKARDLSRNIAIPGDLVFTQRGTLGQVGLVADTFPRYVISQSQMRLRVDETKADPRFVYYWFRTRQIKEMIEARAITTGVPHINLGILADLPIPDLPLVQQSAIAGLLLALDDKIAVNDRLAAVTAELAILLMARSGTTAGTTTGSVCRIHRVIVQPSAYGAEKVAHFSLPAYDNGETPELVDASTIRSAKALLTEPVVLVSKLNPATPRIWRVTPQQGQVCLASPEFLALAPESGVDTATLWAALMQPSFLNSMAAASDGTSKSHQRARPADVLNIEIIDPREVSSALRRQLNSLLERADRSRQESATLAELRDTMLPKLMSGELRVREAERVVSDAV